MNIEAESSDKETLDWKVFSELWLKERGFLPNNRDRYHREAFHWFTQGAHAEMMGRLTP
jgi:hypothetical protein